VRRQELLKPPLGLAAADSFLKNFCGGLLEKNFGMSGLIESSQFLIAAQTNTAVRNQCFLLQSRILASWSLIGWLRGKASKQKVISFCCCPPMALLVNRHDCDLTAQGSAQQQFLLGAKASQ
jgi:hypothetical protein